MDNQSQKPSVFSVMGPTKTFIFGIVFGIMTVSTIGFFIMLFSGNGLAITGSKTDKTGVVFGESTNTNQAVNAAPTGQSKVNLEPISDSDHIRGDLNQAQAVVVEFSDLECPFCKNFHSTMQQVVSDYQGKVAWVYRHFPLDSLHPKARNEAAASECAYEQGGDEAFWQYIDKIFEVTPSNNGLDPAQLPAIAEQIGLDKAKFQSCLESGQYADKINAHEQDAVAAGGQGTPYSVIVTRDGQTIPVSGAQPLATVKSALDSVVQ